MAAPVLPALTMAEARPSRTASAARTTDASFLRRTAGPRVVVHVDDLGGGHDRQVARVGGGDGLGPADEQHVDAEALDGLAGAGDDLARCPVAAHGVDRDGQDHPPGWVS